MPSTKRVLLVDDDEMLRVSLAEQLSADGTYEPVEAATYREGLQKGLEGLYEFMVLDVSLPDGDGRELCRAFRDDGVTCPIVILTASDSDSDTIMGLKAGANDYITKPFRFAVLMARVDAHLVEKLRDDALVLHRVRDGRAPADHLVEPAPGQHGDHRENRDRDQHLDQREAACAPHEHAAPLRANDWFHSPPP